MQDDRIKFFLEDTSHKKSNINVMVGIFLLVLIFGTTLNRLKNFAASGIPTSLDTNVDCGPCADEKSPYCTQLPYQYKKIVWFITDGWAYYRAKSAMDFYANNSIMFTHSVIGDRWSHAVYTAWWTGLPPMNMLGFSVKGDQLWESVARAEGRRCELGWESIEDPEPEASEGGNHIYSFQYTGTLWAPVDVGGGRYRFETVYSFDEFNFVDENYEKDPFTYPTLALPELQHALEHVASKNMSFIAHSGLYDKACHMMTKDNSKRKDAENQYLTDYFLDPSLKKFIDTHPDYLLILSSDHGAYEENSPYFHGDSHTGTLGNIGYLMFYAKDLPPKSQIEIDTVDVLPTICMFLEGCDIPFHSSGVAMNYYGPQAKESDYTNLYKRNLAQLQKAAKYNQLNFDYATIDNVLQSDQTSSVTVRDLTLQLKTLLYDPSLLSGGNFFAIAFQIFTGLAAIVLIMYMSSTGALHSDFYYLYFPAISVSFAIFKYTHIFMQLWHWGFGLFCFCSYCVIFHANRIQNFKAIYCVAIDFIITTILFLWTILITGSQVEGLAAIFTSFCFFGLGLYEYMREKTLHTKLHVVYGLLLILFFCTKHVLELYFMWGFHLFAFLIYGSVIPCIAIYIHQGQLEKSSLPLSAMLLLIRNGDLSVVLLAILFYYVMPILFSVAVEGSQWKPGHATDKRKLALSYSILIFLLHHNYWFFAATRTTLDWDVNPVWGAMGIESWNRFPPLSGAFMGIGKLGLWFVSTFYLLELFVSASKQTSLSHSHIASISDFLGTRLQTYLEVLAEPPGLIHKSKSCIDYLTVAILYSALELVFACFALQFILSVFSPKRAWRAMACLLIIYSFKQVIWIVYALVLKKEQKEQTSEIVEYSLPRVQLESNK